MTGILLACAMLLILSSAYAIILKRKLAETVPLSVVSVVLILFCFGLLNVKGSLLWGLYLIVGLAAASLIYIIYSCVKDKGLFSRLEVWQGCVLFAVFLAISLFFNYGRFFMASDEFSHWGTIVMYFYYADALGTLPLDVFNHFGLIMFPTYLPGISLFQYFFVRLSPEFIEHNLFIAFNMMYFSFVMPLVKDVFTKKKSLKQLILLLVFIILPSSYLPFRWTHLTFYNLLLVDGIKGALLGLALIYYFAYKYWEDFYGLLMVTGSVLMLVLSKEIGLLFALGALTIFATDAVIFKRKEIRAAFMSLKGMKQKTQWLALRISPLLGLLFVHFSWGNLLSRAQVPRFATVPSLRDVLLLFTNQRTPHQTAVIRNFIEAIHDRNVFLNFTVLSFTILFIVIVLIAATHSKEKLGYLRMIATGSILLVGVYIYQFVLLLFYLFFFTEFEAIILASYERYIFPFLLAMMFFVIVFYIKRDDNPLPLNALLKQIKVKLKTNEVVKHKDIYVYGKSFLSLVVGVIFCFVLFFHALSGVVIVAQDRWLRPESFNTRETTLAAERWLPYLGDSKIYFIAQQHGFYYFMNIRFALFPFTSPSNQWGTFRVVSEPDPNIQWQWTVTPEEWANYVISNDYKLVWVYNSDEELERTIGIFFPYGIIQENMVYSVSILDGNLSLIPLEPIWRTPRGFMLYNQRSENMIDWQSWEVNHWVSEGNAGFVPDISAVWAAMDNFNAENILVYIEGSQRLLLPLPNEEGMVFILEEDEWKDGVVFHIIDVVSQKHQVVTIP